MGKTTYQKEEVTELAKNSTIVLLTVISSVTKKIPIAVTHEFQFPLWICKVQRVIREREHFKESGIQSNSLINIVEGDIGIQYGGRELYLTKNCHESPIIHRLNGGENPAVGKTLIAFLSQCDKMYLSEWKLSISRACLDASHLDEIEKLMK
jgi:hypothetical protein